MAGGVQRRLAGGYPGPFGHDVDAAEVDDAEAQQDEQRHAHRELHERRAALGPSPPGPHLVRTSATEREGVTAPPLIGQFAPRNAGVSPDAVARRRKHCGGHGEVHHSEAQLPSSPRADRRASTRPRLRRARRPAGVGVHRRDRLGAPMTLQPDTTPAAPPAGGERWTSAVGANRVRGWFGWVIVELASDAIIVVNEAGRVLLANRAAELLFGF